MPINPFKLERYFARYEFSVKYLLSSSDVESLGMQELLEMALPESLALWQNLRLGYTESQGSPLLRSEIARRYDNIRPENILVAAPEEAIYVAMHSLLAPGDHVIALSPTYQSLYEIARSIGCTLTHWNLRPGPDRWQLELDELEKSISKRTKLLVLNIPNNPTGFLPTRQEFNDILAIADRHGLRIFADEMYRWLESDPALRLPSVSDAYPLGMALAGLSKSHALPGLRIGWLTTREQGLLERCIIFKDYTTICSSAPSEILAIIAVQNSQRILDRNLQIIHANIAAARQLISRHAGKLSWIPPLAGSIAFPEWLGTGSVEDFSQALLDQHGVMLVPGHIFDHPGNHFRLGLGRRNFSEGLEHIDQYLSSNSV